MFSGLDSKNLHHAYLIEGEQEKIFSDLRAFVSSKLKIRVKGNPDYSEEKFESFGIDDARKLSERASLTPSEGSFKFFVLSFGTMTHEAQNALLKLFEEPTKGTHFFLIVPNASIFLPTLLSRLYRLNNVSGNGAVNAEAEKFLALSKAERLAQVKELVDNVSDNKNTRQDVIAFVSSLEMVVAKRFKKNKREEDAEFLSELLKAKRDLYSRSPSLKLLLEHLALILLNKRQ